MRFTLSRLYAIDIIRYRPYACAIKSTLTTLHAIIAANQLPTVICLVCLVSVSVAVLVTTRLGVLVLIRNTPLLCFSLGWLLLVVALLLPFIILLCGC